MTKNEAHVRCAAADYDRFTNEFIEPFDEALAPVVARELKKRFPGPVLLDIGTGTARFLIHLSRRGDLKGVRMVGSDVFADMLDQARAAIAESGTAGIELLLDDAHQMQLPDGFADVILTRSTLHHWHSPVRALREIHRVLKPKGIALICDVRRDAPPEAVEIFNGIRARAGLPPSFLDEKFTPDEIRKFCGEAGIAGCSRIYVPPSGMVAIGMTLMIEKPGQA